MDSYEDKATESNDSSGKTNKYKVSVPVCATIVIQVEIETDEVFTEKELESLGEYRGDKVVDITNHENIINDTVGDSSELIMSAIEYFLAAITAYRKKHSDVNIKSFYTPYAGVINEQEF